MQPVTIFSGLWLIFQKIKGNPASSLNDDGLQLNGRQQ